jgi:hypothetical protein
MDYTPGEEYSAIAKVDTKEKRTHYILESIMDRTLVRGLRSGGPKEYFLYIASDVGSDWLPKLINGYRPPRPCALCGEVPE